MEQKVSRKVMLFSVIISGFFILQSCSGKGPSSKTASPKPSQTPIQQATIEVKEPQLEEKIYEYSKKGKRDIFVPLLSKTVKEVSLKAQSPLENYDVRAIKILGIIQSAKFSLAEALLPDGKSYTLKEGMTVGIYGGKISKITKDSVIVNEQVKDFKGQLKTKETILRLREEEE